MRDLTQLDRYRITDRALLEQFSGGHPGDSARGAFWVPSCIDRQTLCVIAGAGEGWDHVSVSRKNRVPNWYEMEQIKRLFFEDSEVAMQLHMPPAAHINAHPHVLHIWAPWPPLAIPLPPAIFV